MEDVKTQRRKRSRNFTAPNVAGHGFAPGHSYARLNWKIDTVLDVQHLIIETGLVVYTLSGGGIRNYFVTLYTWTETYFRIMNSKVFIAISESIYVCKNTCQSNQWISKSPTTDTVTQDSVSSMEEIVMCAVYKNKDSNIITCKHERCNRTIHDWLNTLSPEQEKKKKRENDQNAVYLA